MGNSVQSGDAALIAFDKPSIANIEPNEEIHAEIVVQGEVITFKEWPANAIGVPPPLDGVVTCTFWAVNVDDEDDRRECGQLIIPHTSLAGFNEPAFQIWLGLLNDEWMPASTSFLSIFGNEQFDFEEAERAFVWSMNAARKPRHPKINLTVAVVPQDLLAAPRDEQQRFRAIVAQTSIMKLLSQSSDIIRALCDAEMKATNEVEACNREFSSKERLWQGFVQNASQQKKEMVRKFIQELYRQVNRYQDKAIWDFAHVVFARWHQAAQVQHDRSIDATHMAHAAAAAKLARNRSREALAVVVRKLEISEQARVQQHAFKSWFTYAAKRFEKKRGKATTELAVMKFLKGNQSGLMIFVLSSWQTIVIQKAQKRQAKASVEVALDMFLEGDKKGLQHGLFKLWHSWAARKAQKKRNHVAVALAVAKFMEGDRTGLLHYVFNAWVTYTTNKIQKKKLRVNTELALLKWIEGESRGLMHEVFNQWETYRDMAKLLDHAAVSAKEMTSYLTDERARLQEDLERQKAEHANRLARGHASVEHALLAWEEGEKKSIQEQFFKWWSKYAQNAAALARKRQSVHDALLKYATSENRAAVQLCFVNWAAETSHAKQQRCIDEEARRKEQEYAQFVNETKTQHGKELERVLSEKQQLEEKAHEATLLMWKNWLLGETRALLTTTVYEWKRYVKIQRELQRRHESAKLAAMSWLEGRENAVCHLCFVHWIHFHEAEKLHRHKDDLQSQLDKDSSRLRTHGRELVSREISKAGVKVFIYYAKIVLLAWRVVALNIRNAFSLGVYAFGNELGHNSTILSDLETEVKLLDGYLKARHGQSPIDHREFRHSRESLQHSPQSQLRHTSVISRVQAQLSPQNPQHQNMSAFVECHE